MVWMVLAATKPTAPASLNTIPTGVVLGHTEDNQPEGEGWPEPWQGYPASIVPTKDGTPVPGPGESQDPGCGKDTAPCCAVLLCPFPSCPSHLKWVQSCCFEL